VFLSMIKRYSIESIKCYQSIKRSNPSSAPKSNPSSRSAPLEETGTRVAYAIAA